MVSYTVLRYSQMEGRTGILNLGIPTRRKSMGYTREELDMVSRLFLGENINGASSRLRREGKVGF